MPAPKADQAGQNDQQLQAQALQFAQCMRAHGVPNFPDPKVSGNTVEIGGGPNSGIDPNSSTFQAAQQACASLLPGKNGGGTQVTGGSSGTSGGGATP